MKIFDTILISLSIGFFIIGAHQSFTNGIGNSYWIFMIMLSLLFWFRIRQAKPIEESNIKQKSGKVKGMKIKSKRK